MTSAGTIFKRCGCRDPYGRRLEKACPRLRERNHGTWYFHCSARNVLGRFERIRRGGYPSQTAARQARQEWLSTTEADRTAQGWTVERWLRHWLDTRTKIRPTTRFHYTRDVEKILIPYLGRYRLTDLDTRLLRTLFAQIATTINSKGRPQSASAMQHLRTTLRAALSLAVREGLLDCNPARHIEISGYQQPHAKVWTDARVERWEQDGERPPVAVWTAKHLATFLGAVTDDSLYAFWWLTALRGLRRGEMCGLRWADIDLDRGVLTVERNRTTAGYQIVEGDPKTPAGRRAVALDKRTVQVLRAHRRWQLDQRAQAAEDGKPWTDTGYVFARADGLPINPNYATTRFRKLVQRTGLPPVRLHDLRHGAASLAHEAGADLKTLQDLLGHSSIVTTADTYTSVLPEVQRRCADATAHLVLAAARRTRKKIKNKARKNRPNPRPKTGAPTPTAPAAAAKTQVSRPSRSTQPAQAPTPTSHPRDTHRPHQADNRKGPNRDPAARTPFDLARPKGLEPLTF
ncbi:tyrosine-type recombinase/integrase [Micromonospora thermarum]|uniref:Site-specific integrase n=1 Tax=Micromonospora thermarum TaxID=2720024 RepID=A0ABX0YY42_9ACTN|nr:tyrosine-type recombinase/integrase [Micromonospora thermarum]NJP30422.1 site-specific integrase [Micromonospora thermarum]